MIDKIRALFPHLSLAVYAYEPGGPVEVEVFTPDNTRFTRKAPTADEAFTAIFGPLPDEETTEQIEEGTDTNEPINPFS